MQPGDLNRRVRIDQRTGSGTLNDPIHWAPLATVWANIRMLTGKESILADAEVGQASASVRIRYRTDVETGMRVTLLKFVSGAPVDELVFDVLKPLPNVATREYVDLVCQTVDGNGNG